MRVLLNHGANVNAASDIWTPLRAAADRGRCVAARLLLDRGAAVNARNKYDKTALTSAGLNGHMDMIRLLLRRGAVVDDARGRPVHVVEARHHSTGQVDAVQLLADVRHAGGTWESYLRFPRTRLLALRVLCERGRAKTPDDALLRRLFTTPDLPKEVFWRIFSYWRCDRDESPRAPMRAPTG